MMIRVLCARLGDTHTIRRPEEPVCMQCSRCSHFVLVQPETLARVEDMGHEIWCLECKHADQRPKIVIDPARDRVFVLPPRSAEEMYG